MKKIKIFFWLIVIIIVISLLNLFLSERVKLYVKQSAITNASSNIASSINNNLNYIDLNDIFNDANGYINTTKINNILVEINKDLENNLGKYVNDKVNIPLGIIFSETLFSNSKINIKIKIKPVSSFTTDVVSEVVEYGINNSLIKINLVVKVKIMALIPFNSEEIDVTTNVPLAYYIREGNVPDGIIYTK